MGIKQFTDYTDVHIQKIDEASVVTKSSSAGNMFNRNSSGVILGQRIFSSGAVGADVTRFISDYIDISDPSFAGKLIRAKVMSSTVVNLDMHFYDANQKWLVYGFNQPTVLSAWKYVRITGAVADMDNIRLTIDNPLNNGDPYVPYFYVDASRVFKNSLPIVTTVYSAPLKVDVPILTIIADDGYTDFNTVMKPTLDAYGYKATLGVITANVGTAGYYSVADLQALQAAGYEIVSHSKTHGATTWRYDYARDNIYTIEDAIRAECFDSYKFLRDNGLETDTLIYPYGTYDVGYVRNHVTKWCRDYYQFGVSAANGYNNGDVLNNMYLNRYQIDKSAHDLTYYQGLIDTAVLNKGWLILFAHPQIATEVDSAFFASVMAYANSKGIAVKSFKDANAIKRNVCSVGTFDVPGGLFIGRSGVIKNT